MLAANLFEHPIVLLIIVGVTVLRWLMQKAKGEAQTIQRPKAPPPPPPSQPITRGGESNSEEERIRKFLEALGQPAGTPPPPKIMPRRAEPQIFPRLPRLKTTPPPLPPVREAWTPAPPPLPPLPAQSLTAPQSNFEVRDYTRQTSSEPMPDTRRSTASARLKLGTPQDLRMAIILREIFGPPRSLQPLDLTANN